MSVNMRRQIPVPTWLVLTLSSITGLGWMAVAHLLGRLAEKQSITSQFVSPILMDTAKAIFIGTSIGLFINTYLKRITDPGTGAVLDLFGIRALHLRANAANEFLTEIRNTRNRRISIMGISLRDFLTAGGVMRDVWEEISHRLQEEEQRNVAEKDRLKVRLLLLDPQSGEGRFRQEAEKKSIGAGGLRSDVPVAIAQINNLLKSIYGSEQSPYLEARLYEHCPFAFCFFSDDFALTEQYVYRDQSKRAALPLVKFANNTEPYSQIVQSYETVWEHARPALWADHRVGVADGIMNARILNIYRHNARYQLGCRQIECMLSAGPGDVVSIQAITGRFYMQTALGTIIDITTRKPDREATRVRFLIINPVSQQAILRAVADSCRQDDIGDALPDWNWERHIQSKLYIDAWQVIWQCKRLQEAGCQIDLNLTPAPLTSSLLLTPGNAFVEQYVYGRSQQQKGIVLGAEFPVFEFEMRSGVEQEMLQAAFDVMWSWFSIPIREYDNTGERENFRQNLELVRAYQRSERASETLKHSDLVLG